MSNRIRIVPETGCWEWQMARDSSGYGAVNLFRNVIRVHRLIAYIFHGIPLKGRKQVVLHTCDNPPCVNPEHLVVGTQADNMSDCSDKGRTGAQKKTTCKRGHPLSGENLYVFTHRNGRTMRTCRTCRKVRVRNHSRKTRHSKLPPDPMPTL